MKKKSTPDFILMWEVSERQQGEIIELKQEISMLKNQLTTFVLGTNEAIEKLKEVKHAWRNRTF